MAVCNALPAGCVGKEHSLLSVVRDFVPMELRMKHHLRSHDHFSMSTYRSLCRQRVTCLIGLVLWSLSASAYDPLAPKVALQSLQVVDLDFTDPERDRAIRLRIYYADSHRPQPVVLFSHGLGGSRENNAYLGSHLAARGYVAVFMQHAGSDEAVWKEADGKDRFLALKSAASAKNAKLRYGDVSAVIDQLQIWNASAVSTLRGQLNLTKIGMSGHSFGAITTQAVSGQQAVMGIVNYTDQRIDAAIAYSPSSPRFGNTKRAFQSVQIPWLLMTGTKDLSRIGNTDMASRLAVFPALPEGDKYELVLNGAEHSAFSARALPADQAPRNPNHHRAILALSTAFWDSYLNEDQEAKDWLQNGAARSVLEDEDRWQTK